MLTFVGLGLYDERSVTIAGRQAISEADHVVAELYTSRLIDADVTAIEGFHDVAIDALNRSDVEREPSFLEKADTEDVVFLTAGDPMMATTHVDLRLRAHDRGIDTRIIHGVTAATAAAGLTGLQNYRFGPATTLPLPRSSDRADPNNHPSGRSTVTDQGESTGVPDSVISTIEDNRERGLHTLVYLDIKVDSGEYGTDTATAYMTADQAAALLSDPLDELLGIAIARAGSPHPVVVGDMLSSLATEDFGEPLHLLVLPGDLHTMERTALTAFADVPPSLLDAD